MRSEPLIIQSEGIVEAWRMATELILRGGDFFNLNVHIKNPASINEADVAQFCHQRVSPELSRSVYDVANTIFPPVGPLHTGNLNQFFAYYKRVYERGQRRHPHAWGTYFLRLIAFGNGSENQLRKVIDGLVNWRIKPRAAFVLHLSSTDLDNPRPLGAPCWQYAQFIRSRENELSLTVVYRSHDYFQKALGNFVGLTRLLKFVCYHTRAEPGTLTCLSTYASLQGKQAKTRQLLDI